MLRSAKRSPLPRAAPVSNSPKDLRNAQILDLIVRCPGLQERIPDTEYSLSFSCGGTEYLLIINLPVGFPFAGPILSVQPPGRHPLLDETSTVCGLADLTAYSIHASLPDIVHQVLSEFITVPLSRREDLLQSVSQPMALGAGAASTTMYMNGGLGSSVNPGGHMRSNSIYSEVNALSLDDLRDWSTNEMKIKEFAESLPHVRGRREALQQLADLNESLAKANLAAKDSLDAKRGEVLAKYEELAQTKKKFEEQQETFRLLERSYAPETLKDGLIRRAQEAEEASEETAQQFLNKELNVDEFLRHFMETRTKSHERNAKAEQLHLQLEALHRAGF